MAFNIINTPANCPFLALSRELRDQIYHYGFEDGPYEAHEGQIGFTVTYGEVKQHQNKVRLGGVNKRQDRSRLPLWLFSCKQILAEGLHQFHSQAICIDLEVEGNFDGCSTGFISLAYIRKMFLTNRSWRVAPESKPEVSKLIEWPQNVTLIKSQESGPLFLFQYLQSHAMALREFSVKLRIPGDMMLEVPGFEEGMELEDRMLDLASFRDLCTGLERVEFAIAEPGIDADRPKDIRRMAITYLLAQKELVSIARGMIQGDSEGDGCWMARDWIEEHMFLPLITDKNSIQHNWHLECRRCPKGKCANNIEHEGMGCWIDFPFIDHHYTYLSDSPRGKSSWYCENGAHSGHTISVDIPQVA